MKRIWIKLYLEILDDIEFGELPEYIKWRAIELFLVAGENGDDGLLPSVARLAWRLRLGTDKIAETLSALTQVGVVHETPEGWIVTNFSKRQRSEEYERVKKYIEKKRINTDINTGINTNIDSISISSSLSDSVLGRGGMGEKPPPTPEDSEFRAHFGEYLSNAEQSRWIALSEAIGFERLQEIASWAEKKEIHMTNRGGLMGSMETAAQGWKDKSKPDQRLEPAGMAAIRRAMEAENAK